MGNLPYNPFTGKENSCSQNPPPENSEDALAWHLVRIFGEKLRYTAQLGEWSYWDNQVWRRDTSLFVSDIARAVCRDAAVTCDDKRLMQKLASARSISAVEKIARSDQTLAMLPEQWDADPLLLNTPSGIVDLRTGDLGGPRSDAYCSKMTAVGPKGECPRWHRFLDRVTAGDAQVKAFIRRLCGYCLTGLTVEQVLVFLYGAGGNGKTVFLATLSGIFGNYGRTAPMDCFTENRFSGHPTELANLQGARLVTAVETEEGRRWNESRIKVLTGSDRIAARFMRGDFFEFQPVFKLLIAGNHRPTLRTVDEAMKRRFRMLPFTTTIPEQERDPRLAEHLRAEWPGILQWMIEGCLEWQRGGLQAPESVQEASRDYLQAEDVLQQWIEECCEIRPNAWAPSSELFASWHRFAETAGEPPRSQKSFSAKLTSHGFQQVRTMYARGFSGIRLRMTHDAS